MYTAVETVVYYAPATVKRNKLLVPSPMFELTDVALVLIYRFPSAMN